MAFAVGVSGVACGTGVGRMWTGKWVVFGLGSGTWIQIYGDGVKDKLLGLLDMRKRGV